MKISELITILRQRQVDHGDLDVYIDSDIEGLRQIEEVDVDADDTGLIIWTGAEL
jgi:ActR/RegA family two-component response regulator